MFKTIAICASLLGSSLAFAEDVQAAPAQGQTETAQPTPAAQPSTDAKGSSTKGTKVSKVKKIPAKKGSQGRSGLRQSRGVKSAAPASDSVAK
jgi:hypothetical protein